MLEFMAAFRETFSRPVKPIMFLGLFDTVNSCPRFENAIFSRTKFPYTGRSSAQVIRHAVSIEERRAKFRQDLIGEKPRGKRLQLRINTQLEGVPDGTELSQAHTRSSVVELQSPERYRDPGESSGVRVLSSSFPTNDVPEAMMDSSLFDELDLNDEIRQDIQEVWFAGGHTVCIRP